MGEMTSYGKIEERNGHEICILDASGDTKVIWDPDNEDEVEAAKEQFDKLIEKGFKAFRVDKKGEPGKEIKKFDASSGRIIMVPQIKGGACHGRI